MADERLIKRLLQDGVESWNAAREEARDAPIGVEPPDPIITVADFSYTNFLWEFRKYRSSDQHWPISLAGVDLVEADLSNAMLRLVDLTNADLCAAFLNEANLNEAILEGADLEDADLQDARLEKANLTRAVLRGAVLTGADLQNATLTEADLTTADLVGANLSGSRPWTAKLFPAKAKAPAQYTHRQGYVGSIADLLSETRKLRRHHNHHHEDILFYFRGEPRCGWTLRPSVMRGGFSALESNMLLELISRRPEEFSEVSSSLAQWVLAQHHGLRTRFLDVTKNPMVALFHACEQNGNYDREDARLHVFAVPRTMVKSFNSDTASVVANFAKLSRDEQSLLLGKEMGHQDRGYRSTNYYARAMDRLCQLIQEEKPYFQNRIDIRDLFRVVIVEPQERSERLRVQSGAFLVSGFHERFERHEIESMIPNVPIYAHYTLSIPYDRKPGIIEDLQLINVKRETLYPGLDESARAINQFHER